MYLASFWFDTHFEYFDTLYLLWCGQNPISKIQLPSFFGTLF